jgi:hypothetical protein
MRTTEVVGWLSRIGRTVPILAVGVALAASPALAQSAAPAPQDSAMVKLIRILAKQGSISQEAADALIEQARAEAQTQARILAAASAAAGPSPGGPPPAQLAAGAPAAQPGSAAPAQVASAAPPPAPGVLRVPYVPEVVKNQIRDQVKAELVAQAHSEGWAAPGTVPSWVNRIEWSGDIRFRDEFDHFSKNNVNGFIDYGAFNANGPTDINDITNPNGLPFLNTLQNRDNLLSLRARLSMKARVTDAVKVVVRLATGNDNSPVSTTQALGGGLGKKNIWLDQAYINLQPVSWGSATFGRAPNPFMHTDLVFDENLNFDGASANVSTPQDFDGLGGFATVGAFPVEYLPGSFPTNSTVKNDDHTKWLLAGQIGGQWKSDDLSVRLGAAYYDYTHIHGDVSAPCALYAGIKQCSTDSTRPAFMQKGNTLFLLRNIVPNPSSPLNFAQPQFVGLSYDYNLIDGNAEIDAKLWDSKHLLLQGDFVRNLAYDPSFAFSRGAGFTPVTNQNGSGGITTYRSGPNAWMVAATFGDLELKSRGDWRIIGGYKYIQPDAVLDAFNDHDFHLGGTNAKGYFVKASYAVFDHTWLSARWFSSNEVYGPPLSIDVLQLELNASF